MSTSAAFRRRPLVVAREVQHDEQVVVVLVDLRALVARADVLVVERVELEVLLEPRAVDRRGRSMLIQRRPATRRSRRAARALRGGSAAARARRPNGLRGRLGIARTERLVGRRHQARNCTSSGRGFATLSDHIAGRIQRGGGTGPMKPRQPARSHAGTRWQFHQAPTTKAWEMRWGSPVLRPISSAARPGGGTDQCRQMP
jgi:hypothetical protein